MRHLPPLAAVRAFEAAARLGNFTRAAEELGMTQAAVSYQIKLLEERLGTPLFTRGGRGIALTDLGRRIAPQVTSGFDLLGEAFAAAKSESDSVLSISAPGSLASNWLAARLGGFQLERSSLAVRLTSSDILVDFARDDVDVAIRASVGPWAGLVSHFLMRVPLAPLASPDFLARHMPLREPADIFRVPRLSPDDLWWERWFEAATGTVEPHPAAPGLRMDSQILEGNAALAGQGLAMLNPVFWSAPIASGHLVRPLPQIAWGRRGFWLVYPESKARLPKVRAFRDWILAQAAEAAIDDPYGAFVKPGEPDRQN